MIDATYEPNGAYRPFIAHIETNERNNKYANTARKMEKPARFKQGFPMQIKNINPAIEKYFWLDYRPPEVLRSPYDEHDNLNFSPLRSIENKPVQVGHKLVLPSQIRPLRYGR